MRNWVAAALALAVVLYLVWSLYYENRAPSSAEIVPYSTFVAEAKQGHISQVVIRNGEIIDGTLKNGKSFRTHVLRDDTSYLEVLLAHGVTIAVEPRSALWPNLVTTLLPFLIIIALFAMIQRQRSGPRT